ncbi:putative acyl-CoA synthetase YngI [Ixodes scapularis]|uniref:putative acyl-CoA synthetase YngI n=1 Tax=Ixodes scapularis TaxID=6945 RepID=UPI001A9D7A11|nr:putative acyl-CoA synthetase YngI [Ixodes scapularis]XP_029826823.2 putative acyl-CoA synthetase YngI [Ixodes scapularis]
MLQSSGSTGPPKLIPLSHFNVLNAIQMLKAMSGFSSERTLMCAVMPLFHTFGHIDLSTFGVVAGVPTVYLPQGAPHAQTLEAIQRYRCTAIQGTPTTYYDLIQCREFDKYDISSLCEGIVGATSIQTSALEMIAEKLKIDNLMTAYGLTETAGPVAFGYRDKRGYHPAPHTEIRIVDAAGSVLPVGEVGEVQVRAPSVFAGYWKHSVTGVYDDGWLPTGDQGAVTDQGTFELKGRIKDLVIKGGVNISPEEVETALLGHDAILEASVVGVPDARLGEEVCAWVKLREGATANIEELQRHCRTKVNSLKVPRYVVIVDEFPRTSVGKVSKPDIRKAMADKLNGTQKAVSEAA